MKKQRISGSWSVGMILIMVGSVWMLAACSASIEPDPIEEDPQAEPMEDVDDAAEDEGADVDMRPDLTLVAPSGSVNLKELTPIADDDGQVVMPAPGIPDASGQMVELASTRLAELKQVDISEITLVSTEAVTWPDSSLGCPKPGMMYLQVLTPGYIVILELDGVTYEYHTDSKIAAVLCE